MSDRELLNQALLLHLWWSHSEVSLRPGDGGGDICALYEKLRVFRSAGVRTTPRYLGRRLRNVVFCRVSLCIEYTCCKISSGFKTGPAKLHPNLAKWAFSKLEPPNGPLRVIVCAVYTMALEPFSRDDSQLIADLRSLHKKSPKLVKPVKYVVPTVPEITVESWKMDEWKYYDIPSPFPTLARGLFSTEEKGEGEGPRYRIIARGYDKFFNIGEVPWTNVRFLPLYHSQSIFFSLFFSFSSGHL
jgi:hypothetical protein